MGDRRLRNTIAKKVVKISRKTTSAEVKARYNNKTYRRIMVNFRLNEDGEILQKIDDLTGSGVSPSDAVKQLIYNSVR